MSRLAVPAAALLGALAACTGSEEPVLGSPGGTPVILISLDTLRADRLNAYGYRERVTSPHIDALAADGVLHLNHVSASPWTTPSHASLLTGLHPTAHGMTQTFSELFDSEGEPVFNSLAGSVVTLAEVLGERGYATAAFTGGITLDAALGFGQGFDLYETSMYKLEPEAESSMLDWLAERQGRSSFLFWHTFEIHAPYLDTRFLGDDRPGLRRAYAAEAARLRDESRLGEHIDASQELRRLLAAHGSFDLDTTSRLYDGGIASADESVGRIVEELKRRGVYDDTLIVLTSDHGEELADHNPDAIYDEHGRSVYEEMIRVPLILKLPGGERAGSRIEAVTRAIDVMPTILDLVGVDPGRLPLQGTSLRPVWAGREEATRIAFTEATAVAPEIKSVRTDRHKLLVEIDRSDLDRFGRRHVPEHARRRLYDLVSDPGEREDLLADPDAEVKLLAEELDQLLIRLARQAAGRAEESSLSDETIRRLRALGYVQ